MKKIRIEVNFSRLSSIRKFLMKEYANKEVVRIRLSVGVFFEGVIYILQALL